MVTSLLSTSCLLLLGAALLPAQGKPLGRAVRAFEIQLQASADEVFPLFGPKKEKLWAPEWNPVFVYPADGEVSAEGAVFTVMPDDGRPLSTWVMTTYDDRRRTVEYVQMSPGHSVTEIHIEVLPEGASRSRARVRYTRTALSPAANAFIAHFEAHFAATGTHWQDAINRYLASRDPQR